MRSSTSRCQRRSSRIMSPWPRWNSTASSSGQSKWCIPKYGRSSRSVASRPSWLSGRPGCLAVLAVWVRASGPGRGGGHRLLRRWPGPVPAGGGGAGGRGGPPYRQARGRSGKPGPLDAVEARGAQAAMSDRACGAAKPRDGNVEAIRALVVANRSARSAKILALNQIRHLSSTAPTGSHRSRAAVIYVRQIHLAQLEHNTESSARRSAPAAPPTSRPASTPCCLKRSTRSPACSAHPVTPETTPPDQPPRKPAPSGGGPRRQPQPAQPSGTTSPPRPTGTSTPNPADSCADSVAANNRHFYHTGHIAHGEKGIHPEAFTSSGRKHGGKKRALLLPHRADHRGGQGADQCPGRRHIPDTWP